MHLNYGAIFSHEIQTRMGVAIGQNGDNWDKLCKKKHTYDKCVTH